MAPDWIDAIGGSKEPFLAMAAQLGLSTDGVGREIDSLGGLMDGAGYVGLVHSDLCPDNTHIADGNCRIIDFETSGWGPVALDVAYLLAPFPSCWCFASLPAEVADPALAAYRDQVTSAGMELGPDWEDALTAALAGWVVARGARIGRALEEDRDWGTTTMRPRLLTWLRSFIAAASRTGALPRLRTLAEATHERLLLRWPDAVVPITRPWPGPARRLPGVPAAGTRTSSGRRRSDGDRVPDRHDRQRHVGQHLRAEEHGHRLLADLAEHDLVDLHRPLGVDRPHEVDRLAELRPRPARRHQQRFHRGGGHEVGVTGMVDVPVDQVTDVRDLRDVLMDGGVQTAEDGDVETVDVESLAFGHGRDLAAPGLPAVDDGGGP